MLIDTIKKDMIQALKDKDTLKKDLLKTLAAEASKEAKVPEDAKVIATIKKFISNAKETLKCYYNGKLTDEEIAQLPAWKKLCDEIRILVEYLPKQLTENEIDFHIKRALTESGQKNIGVIMKYFKTNLEGQYDGAIVSKMAKEIL